MQASETNTRQSAQPRLLVLGGTGGTGRLMVSDAVARGYDVSVLVRSAEKASALQGAKLIVGDARDEKVLRQALEGRDAVISSLGTPASPFREVSLLSSATRSLVSAMKAEQVSRLVSITGMGAGDSAGHGGLLFDYLLFPLLLLKVYADKDRQEAIVRESGLDWVLVRPSVLNNKPGRGTVRALTDLSSFHGGSISRADVATFVLDQVRGDAWLHLAPLITW
ncbi:NAD(P)H-binding protein [Myxococcus sp. K38C18041901]|uniref:NAD(P)-dependent oxidoreductase n=1 Tax=Myxococcus guangdongensis TaxID=2906760 RepID=UPI0020A75CE0|nr:NAD(P)H-binding protein [Myxococcus guangdongensis]MCP3063623.1 NAD(P)H-binding protein [Myxococcus guangdongensis]